MSFHLNNSVKYFKKRIGHESPLVVWGDRIKQSDTPIREYVTVMSEIKKQVGENVNWSHLTKDHRKQQSLWIIRECILAITFITADIIINSGEQSVKIGSAPRRKLVMDHAMAFILGSNTVLSDIDVTILSPQASMHISVIEDLWELTGWFSHSNWKIDVYGDFTTIGKFYMYTRRLQPKYIKQMLKLALASYFRHPKSHSFKTNVLIHIIEWIIKKNNLDVNIPRMIDSAKTLVSKVDTMDREHYYFFLRKAESLRSDLETVFLKPRANTDITSNLLGECIIAEGYANLYREENYILVPTVVQVVKVEQSGIDTLMRCVPYKITVPRCSLSKTTYALSAIEQLGYMQHQLTSGICNMSAGKYFGRLIRSLQSSIFADRKQTFPKITGLVKELANEKKRRASVGNTDSSCKVDLYTLVTDMLTKVDVEHTVAD